MGILAFLKRKKKPETQSERRERLLSRGRLTDGSVIDIETDQEGRDIIHYTYSIHGVDFESSEILTEEQMAEPVKYAPGATVGVRFDPSNHHNSIVV